MPWPIPAEQADSLLDGSQANYELKQKKKNSVWKRGDLSLVRVLLAMIKSLCFPQIVIQGSTSHYPPAPPPFEGLAALCA